MARRIISARARPAGIDRRKGVVWTRQWGSLKKIGEQARRGAHVRVGVLSSGAHTPGIRKSKHVGERGTARNVVNQAFNVTGIDLVTLAAIHEFGAPGAGIPERSFIRRTLDTKHSEITALAGKLAARVVEDKLTLEKALDMLGHFLASQIKQTISEGIPPALKPTTIAAKGSSKPLIDTGQLRTSVSHQVRMTGEVLS